VYLKVKKIINTNEFIIPRARKMIRNEECIRAIERWKRDLLALPRGTLGFRVREILIMELAGSIEGLMFRVTQIGHGCFMFYLYEIRKMETIVLLRSSRYCSAYSDVG